MRNLSLLMIIACFTLAAQSCGQKDKANENPFFTEWDTPFGIPPFDKIRPEHYKPAYEAAIEIHNNEIAAIIENPEAPDFENVILALDNAGEMLSRVSTVFSSVNSADGDDRMREVQKEMSPVLSKHNDEMYLDEKLFEKVKAVYDNRGQLGLDDMQSRLLDKIYKRFISAGALLSNQEKEALKEINGKLTVAQNTFGNNVLTNDKNFVMVIDKEDLEGLPQSVREAAAEKAKEIGENGRYAFNLSKPSLLPFLTYSDRADLREQLYKGYLGKCNYDDENDNKPVINQIMELRSQKAKLLGFDTFADFVIDDRMAESPQAVYDLLDALWTPALERARQELADMKEIKEKETGDSNFYGWDWWYYAEKVRKEKYDLDEETLRPYFSLDNVRQGIFDLSNRLYGITFRPVSVPLYNPECVAYEVLDKDNSHLGVLIMDFHPRDGRKNVGAWCGSYRTRSYKDGRRIDPIVTIVCNFTRPSGNKPALLSLDEMETFFHEFGHALHSLFTDVPYKGLQRTERDFVELPSQIMENWAFVPSMLKKYAVHYSTGAIIPDELIQKIGNSELFNQGFVTVEYLAAAFSDMDIHTIENYKEMDINSFETEVLNKKRGLINEIAPRYRYPYFSHIFSGGYSAGYYSYIWAEVLDKDAFEAFVESGDLYNHIIAKRFRDEVLSKGGSADGMTLYKNFRGKEPAREPLLYARGLLEKPVAPEQPEIIDDMPEDIAEDASAE